MEEGLKGTVTPLSSIFQVEDAQKAAKYIHDSIAEHQKELDHLNRFTTDNANLINLVQRLPDELYHEAMVPFGKAAFFPGRLIHTNEFMILLGEGYYAERTSKQTIEILQRRGKVLESQVDSLKTIMLDLKAEASFFDATATEAAEGLVEIREDYIEENPTERMSKSDPLGSSEANNMKVAAEDEEYARIMSRLDELEKEELANEDDEDEEADADIGCSISPEALNQYLKVSEEHQPRDPLQQSKDKRLFNTTTKKPSNENKGKVPDQSTFDDPKVQLVPKGESSREKSLAYNVFDSDTMEKPLVFPNSMEKVHAGSSKIEVSEDYSAGHTSKTGTDSSKAFTGSIVERSHKIQTNPMAHNSPASSQLTSSNPSKPVSRFKMQKGSR